MMQINPTRLTSVQMIDWFNNNKPKNVIEIGTRRWKEDFPTHHKERFHHENYLMADYLEGLDVDLCFDAHNPEGWDEAKDKLGGSIEGIVMCSVFEHLLKPWIVASNMLKSLSKGGVFFVQTHFCFPLHGYPHDYFRYTEEGLISLFDQANEVYTAFEYPGVLTPPSSITVWDKNAPTPLNVVIVGKT